MCAHTQFLKPTTCGEGGGLRHVRFGWLRVMVNGQIINGGRRSRRSRRSSGFTPGNCKKKKAVWAVQWFYSLGKPPGGTAARMTAAHQTQPTQNVRAAGKRQTNSSPRTSCQKLCVCVCLHNPYGQKSFCEGRGLQMLAHT